MGRPDRASLCVDNHAGLFQAAVQQRVVGRLRAGLADDRLGLSASIRVRGKLARADLAEQAEELAADGATRVAPLRKRGDPNPGELARMLVEEEAKVARDPG